jgi:hypothetical protein
LGDGDNDQDHEESGPVASSTSDATVRDVEAKHAGVPLRRVRAVEGAGRLFSTPSRPALRAAACGGRPRPAARTRCASR